MRQSPSEFSSQKIMRIRGKKKFLLTSLKKREKHGILGVELIAISVKKFCVRQSPSQFFSQNLSAYSVISI